MRSEARILMVRHSEVPWEALSESLRTLGVDPCRARNCDEAGRLIQKLAPEVVLCDRDLPDGSWQNVLQMAEVTGVPTSVIVVDQNDDVGLYLTAMQQGAYDYVAPPVTASDLSYILRCAAEDARLRRAGRAHMPAA